MMAFRPVLLLAGTMLAAAAPRPHTPAEAITIADKGPATGVVGRYEIKVASLEQARHVIWLYSNAAPQAPDTLTFSLSRAVAGAFKRKYGAPAEIYLPGKRLVVDGAARAVIIGSDTKRVVHEVWIYELSQVVSIR